MYFDWYYKYNCFSRLSIFLIRCKVISIEQKKALMYFLNYGRKKV